MFFQTNIPHIKKAVETLSTRQPGDTHDNTAALTAQCKAGLQLLLRNPQSYDTHVTAPSPFTDHFLEALAQLPHPDAVFGLFEDLVIFMREKSLRCHGDNACPVETSLLSHFETLGEWHMGDGTLVSEWYWVRLPLAVIATIIGKGLQLPRQHHPAPTHN